MKIVKQVFKSTIIMLSITTMSVCFADNNIKSVSSPLNVLLLKNFKYKSLINNSNKDLTHNNCRLIVVSSKGAEQQIKSICTGMTPPDCCYTLCSWGGLSLPPDEYDKCYWGCMASFGAL
mgnify:CR=1 FL=1|jgi:hypothetical protein